MGYTSTCLHIIESSFSERFWEGFVVGYGIGLDWIGGGGTEQRDTEREGIEVRDVKGEGKVYFLT